MSIEINEIAKESESLFLEAKNLLFNAHNNEVKEYAQTIPSSFMKDDEKVKVVFCGQYSAGKSSILSILTGKQLDIGGGVTTNETLPLDWNGIIVYDTPGIHTQKHPDHDEITYDAISKSDLLIFVLTNEGFSDNLGKHFRHLIHDMKKGHELMLVVNKMECCAQGNTQEAQEIVSEDIENVTRPLKCKDLYTTFVDAASYNMAVTETDETERAFFRRVSNIDALEQNINRFVKNKGLMGKYAQSLYQLERILDQALSKYKSGNEIIDGAIKLCDDKIKKFTECKDRIVSQLKALKDENNKEVHKIGDKASHSITEKSKKDEINKQLADAQNEINSLCKKLNDDTAKVVTVELADLEDELKHLQDNEFVKNLQNVIAKGLSSKLSISKEQLDKANKIVKTIGNIGKSLAGHCLKEGATSFKYLKDVSGSNVHNVVKTIGHWLGHNFKPWEAVKIADKIGKVGAALGIASAIAGPIIQIWSDNQEDKQEKQIIAVRDEVWNIFDQEAQVIDMKFDENTNTWIQENLMSEIRDIQNQKADLQNTINNKEREQMALESLVRRTRALIDRIHNINK